MGDNYFLCFFPSFSVDFLYTNSIVLGNFEVLSHAQLFNFSMVPKICHSMWNSYASRIPKIGSMRVL